jgi:multisite-specific tRNA:(cytosine-C5)-methyltransferase
MDENIALDTERTTKLPAQVENMEMESKAENPFAQESHAPSPSEKGKKGRKGKAAEGGGSFKEQPYTFLAPDDLILINCM